MKNTLREKEVQKNQEKYTIRIGPVSSGYHANILKDGEDYFNCNIRFPAKENFKQFRSEEIMLDSIVSFMQTIIDKLGEAKA